MTAIMYKPDEIDDPTGEKAKQIEKERGDRPMLGSFFYTLSMIMMPLELFVLKYLFDRYPTLGAFQLVVGQRLIGILIIMLFYNVSLKKKTWDNLKGKPKGGLAFRSIQAALAGIIKTIITK